MCAEIKCAPKDSRPLFLTQEKKLKNWYIQEYMTGTTFEPNIKKTLEKISDDDNGQT